MIDIDSAVARFEAELKAAAVADRIEAEKLAVTARNPKDAGYVEGQRWAITKATYKILKELAALKSFLQEDPFHYKEYKRYKLHKKMEAICTGEHSPDYLEGFFYGALDIYEQVKPRIEQYKPVV